jgi:hypothetical protein
LHESLAWQPVPLTKGSPADAPVLVAAQFLLHLTIISHASTSPSPASILSGPRPCGTGFEEQLNMFLMSLNGRTCAAGAIARLRRETWLLNVIICSKRKSTLVDSAPQTNATRIVQAGAIQKMRRRLLFFRASSRHKVIRFLLSPWRVMGFLLCLSAF